MAGNYSVRFYQIFIGPKKRQNSAALQSTMQCFKYVNLHHQQLKYIEKAGLRKGNIIHTTVQKIIREKLQNGPNVLPGCRVFSRSGRKY
jgi:hypothetical protein